MNITQAIGDGTTSFNDVDDDATKENEQAAPGADGGAAPGAQDANGSQAEINKSDDN